MARYEGFGDPREADWSRQNLGDVVSQGGVRFRVNKRAVDAFQGFINELEESGYKIRTGGGYNLRNVTGESSLSPHAYGVSIDINPTENPYSKTPTGGKLVTDLPPNIAELAAKYGLEWGGNWNSLKDPMHFELAGARSKENNLVPGIPAFRNLPERIEPVNALSLPEVASSPSTPPTAIVGDLEPGSRLASAVALMALAGAGTHRFVPISYDPFKVQKAAAGGEMPETVQVPTREISVPKRELPKPETGLSPVKYVTKTGMKRTYLAPELNLGAGNG
jgi:hypothetical protein